MSQSVVVSSAPPALSAGRSPAPRSPGAGKCAACAAALPPMNSSRRWWRKAQSENEALCFQRAKGQEAWSCAGLPESLMP
jgi:uncharacterized protein involved in tolerance to divalent cations